MVKKYNCLRTDSVRCVLGVRYQAVIQVKQSGVGSVLGWVTAGPRPAYRNAEREVIFSEPVDWGQTLLNGWLYRHRFSAVFLCLCVNAIQHRRKWHILRGGGALAGRKEKRALKKKFVESTNLVVAGCYSHMLLCEHNT